MPRASLRKRGTNSTHALREKAISEFHDLLAAGKKLTPEVFEKLRSVIAKTPSRCGPTFFITNNSNA